MNIIVVGLSHKTAPVEIRERVAFAPTAMEKPLRQVAALPGISEGLIVSTCNRVEVYAVSREAEAGIAHLRHFMADYHGLPTEELDSHLYDYQGEAAIQHIFRVASSLDSMVIGEPQILGQIKTAYGYAAEFKTAGLILNRLLHKAFSVAKRVRTETEIASNAVSVSFAAVELARKIFDSLTDKTVLLIGAGEMCELAARHFMNNGVAKVHVTNRTFERAQKLADEFGGKPILFDNFVDHLPQIDIVLTSTGAPNFILGHKTIEEVIRRRKYKPMFFIDIAVPRDIDPRVNAIENVYLYDVDDLQGVVQANLKERHKEAKKAEGDHRPGDRRLLQVARQPRRGADHRRPAQEARGDPPRRVGEDLRHPQGARRQGTQVDRGADRGDRQQGSAPADDPVEKEPERSGRRELRRGGAGSLRPRSAGPGGEDRVPRRPGRRMTAAATQSNPDSSR